MSRLPTFKHVSGNKLSKDDNLPDMSKERSTDTTRDENIYLNKMNTFNSNISFPQETNVENKHRLHLPRNNTTITRPRTASDSLNYTTSNMSYLTSVSSKNSAESHASNNSSNSNSSSSSSSINTTNKARFIPRTLPISSIELEDQMDLSIGKTVLSDLSNSDDPRDKSYRLWKDIDVLDDVKLLIEDRNKEITTNSNNNNNNNFFEGFPNNYENDLEKLRENHLLLLNKLRKYKDDISSTTSMYSESDDKDQTDDGLYTKQDNLQTVINTDDKVKKNGENNSSGSSAEERQNVKLSSPSDFSSASNDSNSEKSKSEEAGNRNSTKNGDNVIFNDISKNDKELEDIVQLLNQLQNT